MQGDNPEAVALPSWKTVKDTTLYTLQQVIIDFRVESLHTSESACIMFDGWDGGDSLGQIIGVTYNWVDQEWNLHSALLDLIPVAGNHTGAAHCVVFFLTYLFSSSFA